MRMNKLILATGLSAALAVPAVAQAASDATMANKAPTTKVFVKKAAMTNMFEIKAGKIAKQKIDNKKVENYADMIINDHQKMQNKLKSQAKNIQGVSLPSKLDEAHQAKIDKLQKEAGAQFLKTFKTQQVQGHEQGVRMFYNYAQYGQNPTIKQLAKNGVPVLKKHLRHAQNLPTSLPAAPTVGSGSSQK